MKKGISALFALSLLFVMAASPAFAAVGLTIEGKSSVSRDITYYVLPKGGAPASVSTTIGGVSTTGFGSNAYDLFLSNGWQLNGKDSLSFNADISGKSFSISGPPAEGSLMLTLTAKSDDANLAEAFVQINFEKIDVSVDVRPPVARPVQKMPFSEKLRVVTTPEDLSISEMSISDGTTPADPVKWNGLVIKPLPGERAINVEGTPIIPGEKTFALVVSGDWGNIETTFRIDVSPGKVDMFHSRIMIADEKLDYEQGETVKTFKFHEYGDFGTYTNFNYRRWYYVVFTAPVMLSDLRVYLQEPGSDLFKLVNRMDGEPPIHFRQSAGVTREASPTFSTEGYYLTSSETYPLMVVMRMSPYSNGSYTFRLEYTSNGFREHVQLMPMRCTPPKNAKESGGGCASGAGVSALAVLALLVMRRRVG